MRLSQAELQDAIRWAGQAAIAGTDANARILAALAPLIPSGANVSLTNPPSSRDNGVAPALTRVLLCEATTASDTTRVCVKLYPPSVRGISQMQNHATLLSALKGTVPVPEIVRVFPTPAPLGFPALVTSAVGHDLGAEMGRLSPHVRQEVMADFAEAVLRLHRCPLGGLPIERAYDPDEIRQEWQRDAIWYADNSSRADGAAVLVSEAASVLAACRDTPDNGCLVHRDLTPHNVLTADGQIVAIVDWDHAGVSAPYEDVGKVLVGSLGALSILYSARLEAAREFLRMYAQGIHCSTVELHNRCLPFALDTLLDWVIGIKNAPREDLVWATEQILAGNYI